MRFTAIALTAMVCTSSSAIAQSSVSSSGSSTGAGGQASSTLSNGSTISGTGGSPGPNTSNALNHGTTGSTLGTRRPELHLPVPLLLMATPSILPLPMLPLKILAARMRVF